jgi:chromate transporter
MPNPHSKPDSTESGSALEVLIAFLKLGLTSFGGPVAHIGYFRIEFVEKRRWLDESHFAQLLAICQFLPGPASSQLGFAVGLLRAGWPGAIAAFVAFTLPSALLLFGFAALLPLLSGETGIAATHGLKLVAVAFVAHAVFAMSRQLCPDPRRQTLAVLAAAAVLLAGSAQFQFAVIALGAAAGWYLCTDVKAVATNTLKVRYGMTTGWVLLIVFAVLLAGLQLLPANSLSWPAVFGAFYHAGALVFGGGHVVLPMLEETVVSPGWVSPEAFLSGYGAAQAVPGPLFSVAAYLGAQLPGNSGGAFGAAVALLGIFLPGFLLVSAALPLWRTFSGHPAAARAIAGANAAVVGLLAAAFYDPVFTTAVKNPTDFAIGLVALLLLAGWRRSPLIIVAWCVAASIAAMWAGLA